MFCIYRFKMKNNSKYLKGGVGQAAGALRPQTRAPVREEFPQLVVLHKIKFTTNQIYIVKSS